MRDDELSERRGGLIIVDDGPPPPLTAEDALAWRESAVNLAATVVDITRELDEARATLATRDAEALDLKWKLAKSIADLTTRTRALEEAEGALEEIRDAKCGDVRQNCHHMGEICRAIARRALATIKSMGTPAGEPVGEATGCEPWCGTKKHDAHGSAMYWTRDELGCFCTKACADAGRPLHPTVSK